MRFIPVSVHLSVRHQRIQHLIQFRRGQRITWIIIGISIHEPFAVEPRMHRLQNTVVRYRVAITQLPDDGKDTSFMSMFNHT